MRTMLGLIAVVVLMMGGAAYGAEQEVPSPMTIEVGKESPGGTASAAGGCTRTISVSGTAVTRTMPDTIVWRITISDYDKNLMRAKESSEGSLPRLSAPPRRVMKQGYRRARRW